MINVDEVIDRFKAKARDKDAEWKKQHKECEAEHAIIKEAKNTKLMPCLKKANPIHYSKWLEGFIENGGEPTHSYNYPMPDSWYVATRDFETFYLCGSSAIHIIVPENINWLGGYLGHCNLYFMKDYIHKGSWVPIYSDI